MEYDTQQQNYPGQLCMKTYLLPFSLYAGTFLTAAALRLLLEPVVPEPFITMLFWVFIASLFVVYIGVFGKGRWGLLGRVHLAVRDLGLIVLLAALFAVHNIVVVEQYGAMDYTTDMHTSLPLVMAMFAISSIGEEIVYRGFIQSYINERVAAGSARLSRGNIVASVLMLVSHAGFFTVMQPVVAVTALILVALFSFTAGFLKDRTGSLWVPMAVHILCNYIHVFIHRGG